MKMKTAIKYILFWVLCVSSIASNAQQLTNAERRKMYMDVLNLINNYERYAEVKQERRSDFLRLFRNSSTSIYNDLMGISELPALPASEYADSMISLALYPDVIIRNVVHDAPFAKDGKWYMNVSFAKELEYMDSHGIFEFSSSKHYGTDYQIRALVSWDGKIAKFESLEGSIDSPVAPYPVNYMIFEPRHPNDSALLFNGNPIALESYDGNAYAILPKATTKAFTYTKDKDVHIRLKNDEFNKVYMSYKPKRWRVKARYEQAIATQGNGFSWSNPLSVDAEFKFNSNSYNQTKKNFKNSKGDYAKKEYDFTHTTSMRALGLDLGYIFPSSGSVKWGFFTGAALRQTDIRSQYADKLTFNRESTEDEDGDTYLRQYTIWGMTYDTKVQELYFPAYFDMDIRCSSRFSIYLDFGAKVYWAFNDPVTTFDVGTYAVTGMYPTYGNIVFDGTSFGGYGLNGFVNGKEPDTWSNIYSTAKNYGINFSIDAFAGLGFRVRVFRDLYLDLGCNYQYNVGTIVDRLRESGTFKLNSATELGLKDLDYLCEHKPIKDENMAKDPLYYKDGKETPTSVSQYYKKIDRNALQFNVGLMFRF